jgi:hypothetical protein
MGKRARPFHRVSLGWGKGMTKAVLKWHRHLACFAVIGIVVSFAADAFAQQSGKGAVVPLSARAQAEVEKYLPGVVGEPIPAFTIHPSMAALSDGTHLIEVVSGDDKGKIEKHEVHAGKEPGTWVYRVGGRTLILKETGESSLSLVSERIKDEGVTTQYAPPQPILIDGMNAGDKKKTTIDVKVYDIDDPSDLKYTGQLDLEFTYHGAYKVTVPAGTFDAAAIVSDYKGKVGPAKIEDLQVLFVAKDGGLIASAQKQDISAMLVYNESTKEGLVLKE